MTRNLAIVVYADVRAETLVVMERAIRRNAEKQATNFHETCTNHFMVLFVPFRDCSWPTYLIHKRIRRRQVAVKPEHGSDNNVG